MKRSRGVHTCAHAAAAASPRPASWSSRGCGPARRHAAPDVKSVTVARAARSTISVSIEYAARIRPSRRSWCLAEGVRPGRHRPRRREPDGPPGPGAVHAGVHGLRGAGAPGARGAGQRQGNLTRTSDSSLSSQVIQAQAAVDQAKVQYDDAQDLADRMEKLFRREPSRASSATMRRPAPTAPRSPWTRAKQNLSLLQDKGGPQSTGVASSQVDQAQASADLAESQLSNTVIVSPITGVVATRAVDPGELVAPGSPAFVVIDVSSVTAEASVDEAMVQKIRPGEHVPVSVDAAGTDPWTAWWTPSARRPTRAPRATS